MGGIFNHTGTRHDTHTMQFDVDHFQDTMTYKRVSECDSTVSITWLVCIWCIGGCHDHDEDVQYYFAVAFSTTSAQSALVSVGDIAVIAIWMCNLDVKPRSCSFWSVAAR